MYWPKNLLIFTLLTIIAGISFAQQSVSIKTITDKQHPRILLLKGEERQIAQSISANPIWKKMHEAILKECDSMLLLPPVERIQIGRRLLDKSREALRRVFYLSYAWRLTGQEKYFRRCEMELLAVSKFSDWNPSHFLDVAEMTMAEAIGYDWLYTKLSDDSKRIIREAIVNKGINPSLEPKNNGWLKDVNNWNQVCNAGMTFGALAVADDFPELSKSIIDRAINSISLPMGEYKPDGAYPEGYNYWGYGTLFNVMFLSAIEKVFSSDFGLNKTPGFLQTAGFLQNMTGVTGLCYNWGDSGSGGNLSPAMFWFAQRNNDLSQLWVEKSYLQKGDFSKFTDDRLLPAVMIWEKDVSFDKVTEPKIKVWKGEGANPVCLMRTSWTDRNGIYLGFKAGSASVNHGHMDIGSFVMEADGSRWASDFGMQEYESLESKGIQVFGRTQDAQRWSIFRINNFAHNTLTVDHQLQLVKGYAKIDQFSDQPDFMYAISDLSSVYENQLAEEKRGVAIVNQKFVVIRDELTAANKPTTIRWTMMTSAIPVLGENSISLSKEGHTLVLKVNSPSEVIMQTWPTEPTTSYDAPNPGKTLVGFEIKLEANQR
ncbi:MAG TPA: heparinase II/III family protein, partial [Prolixibacteraceae bacterium]